MNRHRITPLAWFFTLFSATVAAIFFLQATDHYPTLTIEVPSQGEVEFLLHANDDRLSCEGTLMRLSSALRAACPNCKISDERCTSTLSERQSRLMSDAPISQVSAHLPNGVAVYSASSYTAAMEACQESQRHAPVAGIQCFAPDTQRKFFSPKNRRVSLENIASALAILLLAQIVAKLVCYLLVRYERLHAHLSLDATDSGPQKFHAIPTPRIGGVALIVALLVSCVVLTAFPQGFSGREFGLLLVSAMPAFLGGLTEDVTKKVGIMERLLLTMLSAAFGALCLHAILARVDVPQVDALMQWTPVAVVFTVFAVAGATNSINIIDGYNGLAAGFGVIASVAFAFISVLLGDTFLLNANFAMLGALLGFLVWNWPGGKIFLGDGGAYLLGFWLSEMSILLLSRHPELSVWFPMLVMIYPVFETLFSIYRRKIKRNQHPGHPDAMHLHQLIYSRLVRIHVGTRIPALKTMRNSRVSIYLWILTGLFGFIAVSFWNNPVLLASGVIAFCVIYVVTYGLLTSWRSPSVLRIQRVRMMPADSNSYVSCKTRNN